MAFAPQHVNNDRSTRVTDAHLYREPTPMVANGRRAGEFPRRAGGGGPQVTRSQAATTARWACSLTNGMAAPVAPRSAKTSGAFVASSQPSPTLIDWRPALRGCCPRGSQHGGSCLITVSYTHLTLPTKRKV